jgi:hypothetical protein
MATTNVKTAFDDHAMAHESATAEYMTANTRNKGRIKNAVSKMKRAALSRALAGKSISSCDPSKPSIKPSISCFRTRA